MKSYNTFSTILLFSVLPFISAAPFPVAATIIEQSNAPWSLQRISSESPVVQNGRNATELNYKYRYDEQDNSTGVDVYIVDSGVDVLHPEFGGRASTIFTAVPDPRDLENHGTHVAGIVGSIHFGAAKNASIWGIKVFADRDEDSPNGTPGPELTVVMNDVARGVKQLYINIINARREKALKAPL
ncbi:Cerevisin [Dactylellina cionopaga]|nr:Cerevisin [Dactylellina cionopaga]